MADHLYQVTMRLRDGGDATYLVVDATGTRARARARRICEIEMGRVRCHIRTTCLRPAEPRSDLDGPMDDDWRRDGRRCGD